MSTRGGDDDLNSEINVTPLVDVMLVLLIIFMITAPMLNTGVALDLPSVTAEAPDDPNSPLVLSIKKGNALFLSGTQIKWADLGAKIKANQKIQDEKKLYIGADRNLPYGVVATAMALVKRAGVEHVLLLTNPSEEQTPESLDQTTTP